MFQAEYLMPGIEGFSLDDPECKGLRIIPDIPVGIKGDDLLRNAYQDGYLGTSDKTITATWIGRFRWKRDSVAKSALRVREIRDVVMIPK
jgi:hypothetical protein